jgi:hypothetical protein
VTIATVGYGDISPITMEGQVMVILLLFLILSLIPYQTSKLLEALSATNPYLRASYYWRRRRRHIILMGSLDHLAVNTFVHEVMPCRSRLAPPGLARQTHSVILGAALHSDDAALCNAATRQLRAVLCAMCCVPHAGLAVR